MISHGKKKFGRKWVSVMSSRGKQTKESDSGEHVQNFGGGRRGLSRTTQCLKSEIRGLQG